MCKHGTRFPKIPPLYARNPNRVYTGYVWILAALLSKNETLWRLISSNAELRTSKWYGWMLTYTFNQCFKIENSRQSKIDPFKLASMSCINSIVENISKFDNLEQFFEDIDQIFYCELVDEYGDCIALDEFVNMYQDDIITKKIVIMNGFHYESTPEMIFRIREEIFELRNVIGITNDDDNKWDGVTYSRHGNYYEKWWKEERVRKPVNSFTFLNDFD